MNSTAILLLAALSALLPPPDASSANELSTQEKEAGFQLLFNGKSLDGWDGDPDLWKVEDGILVGSTDNKNIGRNTFLIFREQFSDFHLKAEVKLRNGNSGIQFRSKALDGPGWVVSGYQVDFSHDGERSAWGNLYEERGRGRNIMPSLNEGWQKAKAVIKPSGWNHLELVARGNRIVVNWNGVTTIDTMDDAASSGVIAIQLHRGDAMRVEIRNLRLRPLLEDSQ